MTNLDVKIKLDEKSYPIVIDQDKIENLKSKILASVSGNNVLVVISEKVYKLYNSALGFDKNNVFILKDGEKEKNFKNYKKILNMALKMQLTRKDAIIAIGGGVVGDIAGFVAATYMRGIDYIQVPTTLLACVDSSVGGKVAVNTDFGKNLVGCFYQPKAVFINLNFLKTLDERQYKTGLGEVVKYVFIEKSCPCEEEFNLSNFVTNNTDKIIIRNAGVLEQLIEMCIKLKISVVSQDEKERGLRRILNFGHTLGHAIECLTNYKKYTHGEAVVKGMIFAFDLAEKRGLIDKTYKYLANDLINRFNFRAIPDYPVDKLKNTMRMDKKADCGKILFILPSGYSEVKEVSLFVEEIFTN